MWYLEQTISMKQTNLCKSQAQYNIEIEYVWYGKKI